MAGRFFRNHVDPELFFLDRVTDHLHVAVQHTVGSQAAPAFG
jgi:hypothetical protein